MQKKLEKKKDRKFNRGNTEMEIEDDKEKRPSLRELWNDPSKKVEKRRRKI